MALNTFTSDLGEVIDEMEGKGIKTKTITEKILINKMKMRSNKLIEMKSFNAIDRVFHFSIDCHHNYETSKPLPRLKVPEDGMQLDMDLEKGFDECLQNNRLIVDYDKYRDKKWEYFMKCIKQNDLITKYKPQFVSFGGPVADIMASIYDTSVDWKMSAQMTNGVIYLFKTRNERNNGLANRRSFCGLNFLNFITDRNDKEMNEFEKYFAINCVELDSHKLLTLNEIDAIDGNEKSIDSKLVKEIRTAREEEFYTKKKLLRFWSKAVVQGMDRLVIGFINSDNFLLEIKETVVSDIPNRCDNFWSDLRCIDFLNRLLSFLKTCISEEDLIYELAFNRGEEFVSCHRLEPKQTLSFV